MKQEAAPATWVVQRELLKMLTPQEVPPGLLIGVQCLPEVQYEIRALAYYFLRTPGLLLLEKEQRLIAAVFYDHVQVWFGSLAGVATESDVVSTCANLEQ